MKQEIKVDRNNVFFGGSLEEVMDAKIAYFERMMENYNFPAPPKELGEVKWDIRLSDYHDIYVRVTPVFKQRDEENRGWADKNTLVLLIADSSNEKIIFRGAPEWVHGKDGAEIKGSYFYEDEDPLRTEPNLYDED